MRARYKKWTGNSFDDKDEVTYENIREMPEIEDMQAYPEEGSIKKIGDIFVIKLAKPY